MPAIMLHPAASAADLVLDCDPLKHNPGHLFLCQPHAIQIIQLVEATPPPRRISSVILSSSAGSSYPSTSDDDDPSSCSSYCSSIVTPDESSHTRQPVPWTDDTYSTRMKRVHAWRDAFLKATCTVPEPQTPSLKRKSNPHQTDDDAVSHTSKRSRDGHSISRLTGHPCPACDTLFPSLSSLQKHGRAKNIHEACRVAVEYDLE
ncbi:hypothetical protein HD554DRAFT_2053654 [Boletus coccyginus]|nr:hypothetical protein HD554DRAFT_2053654 [Boletus coccyginus]